MEGRERWGERGGGYGWEVGGDRGGGKAVTVYDWLDD